MVTPRWQTVTVTEENREQLVRETALPVVVKPIASGSSIGVYIAKDRRELDAALRESIKLGGRTVLEQYIQGREIQVAVLDGRALPSIEIIPKQGFYDYENKYQPGAALEVCPAPIPPEWEERVGRRGPGGVPGHWPVRICPGGFYCHGGRNPLFPGDQHPARHDAHQPGAAGGGGGGHRLRRSCARSFWRSLWRPERRTGKTHGSHHLGTTAGGGGRHPAGRSSVWTRPSLRVETDSRTIHPGSLFIPLVGERFDGHAYIDSALEGGAVGCLTARERESYREDKFYVKVAGTQRALRDLAAWYKARFDIPFVAVTGSVGKTTAKDMIAAVLGTKYRVLKDRGQLQ